MLVLKRKNSEQGMVSVQKRKLVIVSEKKSQDIDRNGNNLLVLLSREEYDAIKTRLRERSEKQERERSYYQKKMEKEGKVVTTHKSHKEITLPTIVAEKPDGADVFILKDIYSGFKNKLVTLDMHE